MKKNFVIIHYNTPSLTECLVRSINLFVDDAIIFIFDNSDKDPFTAQFSNVSILDNTKGEIIDFDKWLTNYPNRYKSNGRVNSWGSAKHCYSVEKCMEIIKEDFILLDSDVLLKRDVSSLFNKVNLYCGEIITQPRSTIKRVSPFICYINTEMCIKNNVHYFNEDYMHGLCNARGGDSYDTGAFFYLACYGYKHKPINVSDYIVHYGHGSWDKKEEEPKITSDDWLKLNKKYWSGEKNTKVVYTCITGDYDTVINPKYITEGFDYICFTDNEELTSSVWDIRPLPSETEGLSQIKKQRYVKTNPHKLLHDYDLSIWVDGNVEIKSNLNEFIDEYINDDCSIYVPQHPNRDCIYDEAVAVIGLKKDTEENVNPQIERYENEGFPRNYGLLQSNILLRKHNSEDCIKLMEEWFNEIKNGSHRDQLSFNYVLWKNDEINVVYMDKQICQSEWFNWLKYHKKNVTNNIPKIVIKKNKIKTDNINLYR